VKVKKRIVSMVLFFAMLASSIAVGQWGVSAAVDTTPPVLQGISIDNSAVPKGVSVNITVKASDASGIDRAVIRYASPSGTEFNSATLYPDAGGNLKTAISTADYSEFGKWKVDSITLYDNAGNSAEVFNSERYTAVSIMDLSAGDFQLADHRFAPTGLKGIGISETGASDGRITGTSAFMEYRLSTETGYKPAAGAEITGLAAGTYCVRYAARDGFTAGTDAYIVIKCQFEVSDGVLVKYYGAGGDVVIPGNLGITRIGSSAFFSCSDLTSVKIPEGVTAIGDKAFYFCEGLTYITIPSGVTSIGSYAFAGCKNLKAINAYPLVAPAANGTAFGTAPSGVVLNTLPGAAGYSNAPWSSFAQNTTALSAASIEVTAAPIKTDYLEGQSLNLTGMVVSGVFADGTKAPLAVTAANVSGFDSSAPAVGQKVTVDVGGKTAAFQVNIKAQPEGTASTGNLAAGKLFTSSVFANLAYATDGSRGTYSIADDYPKASGLQYIQLDLGASYDLNEIDLWHYYGDMRKYHDVVIQVSNDPAFSSGATTVFNNDADNSAGLGAGTDREYYETSSGLGVAFDAVKARYVRLYSNGSTMNSNNHYAEIEVYGVESTPENAIKATETSNIAEGKQFVSSAFSNLSVMTDGSTNTNAYADDYPKSSGLQYVQVDLGGIYDISSIKLWHYYGDGRKYKDVIVQVSNDPAFASGVTTVYNNDTNNSAGRGTGKDSEYIETSTGMNIAFGTVRARYVRFYSNGSNVNSNNHYVESEIYGDPSSAAVNQAAGKSMTASAGFSNLAKVTDGNKDTINYSDCYPTAGLQWLQVDLGASFEISGIKLWHYFGDTRKYHDVIVQVSDDPTFKTGVATVYSNDADGSAGLGTGTNSEYAETSAGLDIPVTSVNGRYVRLYSNGSTANSYNHYVELEVYGK